MDFAPERWETVVEDVAQVVALGLERAEDLADVLGDLVRGRPGLPKIAAAVAVGMVLGSFAERLTRAQRPRIQLPVPRLGDGRPNAPDVSSALRRLPVRPPDVGR